MALFDPWNMVCRHFPKVLRSGLEPQTLQIENWSLKLLGCTPTYDNYYVLIELESHLAKLADFAS